MLLIFTLTVKVCFSYINHPSLPRLYLGKYKSYDRINREISGILFNVTIVNEENLKKINFNLGEVRFSTKCLEEMKVKLEIC